MPGIIIFSSSYKQNERKDQIKKTEMSADRDYSTDAMVALLVAAGKNDARITEVVGDVPVVINIGELMASVVMTTKGILTSPAPLPLNQAYHQRMDDKAKAIKNNATGYVEVIEGLHISYSCADPHLTIYVYGADGKVKGTKLHICAEPDGKGWKYKSIHQ